MNTMSVEERHVRRLANRLGYGLKRTRGLSVPFEVTPLDDDLPGGGYFDLKHAKVWLVGMVAINAQRYQAAAKLTKEITWQVYVAQRPVKPIEGETP